jgi:predicted transcriptional regulator
MKKIVLLLVVAVLELFALEVGDKVPYVELSGTDGGYLDANKWKSTDMDAKINIIFYVDPDLKDLNDLFAGELQELHLSVTELKVFVIINMRASWIPNMLIDTVLKSKQKKFPEAQYVKDNNRVLVKNWTLKDDAYDVIVVDKRHEILFSHIGKITPLLSEKIIKKLNW